MWPLSLMKEGERGEIAGLDSRDNHGQPGEGCREHLFNMGLRPGTQVEMITNRGGGPLVLRLDESRIALGRGMAMKITVRRKEE